MVTRDRDGDTWLHYYVRGEKNEAVLQEVEKCVDCLGWKNNDQVTVLHYACEYLNEETIKKLLEKAHDFIDLNDKYGNTWLHYAVRGEKNNIVLREVEKTVDCLGWKNNDQKTVLHYACKYLNEETIKILLEKARGQECIAYKDKYGDTWLHYAVRGEKNEIVLQEVRKSVDCLGWENNNQITILHDACEYLKEETIQELLRIARNHKCIAYKDKDGDTWLHYAVRGKKDEVVLQEVEKGVDCLGWKNNNQVTVLHYACEHLNEKTIKILLEKSKSHECIDVIDKYGNTWLHYAVRGEKNGIVLQEVRNSVDCLGWKNNDQITVLHYACEYLKEETIQELLEIARSHKCIDYNDKDGDTWLHYATRGGKNVTVLHEVEKSVDCLGWKNNDQITVFHYACQYLNRETVLYVLQEAGTELMALRDSFDNTSWHYLFKRCSGFGDGLLVLEIFNKEGVNPQTANLVGQNALQGSTMDKYELEFLLRQAVREKASVGKIMFSMLNCKGFHIVHSFAGKYELSRLITPLSELSNMTYSDLLRLPVSHGPQKGATCLHFAYEAGHIENIEFLMKEGLKLSAETEAGLNCIEFACLKGKVNEIVKHLKTDELPGCNLLDLLRLFDPSKRALRLPDLSAARELLASISDESMTRAVHKDRPSGEMGKKRKMRNEGDATETDKELTGLRLLLRAVEIDSSEIFHCAIKLNFITPDTEAQFPAFLDKTLQSKSLSVESFTNWQDFFNSSRFTLSMIDLLVFFDKIEILTDMILIRQFDLIPACISLLIALKSKIGQKEGKHEQLKQLYSRVTSIAVTALDELYFNADEDQKKLLFDYIKGELNKANESTKGPKFLCSRLADESAGDRGTKYFTVMELIEHSGDVGLFATDCMYQLINRDWQPDSQNSNAKTPKSNGKKETKSRSSDAETSNCNDACPSKALKDRFTPKVNFYSHVMCYTIFLVYFAWYITDFRQAFQFWYPDLVLSAYAVSFTLGEISDIRNRKGIRGFYLQNRHRKIPEYFKDVLNYFDIGALLFMWIGLVWKLVMWRWITFPWKPENEDLVSSTYTCQMMFSSSFLLWGFRSVSFLSYSNNIGPAISMFRSLLIKDLVPFLTIIFVMFYSFGVFFFNLLFPTVTSPTSDREAPDYIQNVLVQIFTLPFNLLFSNGKDIEVSNGTNQLVRKYAHPVGLGLYENLLIFVFLFIVNVVMMNLLIARFSLTVSRKQERIKGIWRKASYKMLVEYSRISPLPPPLAFLYYIYHWTKRLDKCCQKCDQNQSNGNKSPESSASNDWWTDESKYPDEYKEFLKFQATHFRRLRPKLKKKTGTGTPMVQTENFTFQSSSDHEKSFQRQVKPDLKMVQNATDKLPQNLQNENDSRLHNLEQKIDNLQNLLQNLERKMEQKIDSLIEAFSRF